MLHPRRPQSNAITASIATTLIVVLLAVADLGTSIQPSRTPRLKCLSTGGPVRDPKNARVVTCFAEPSFCEWSYRTREKSYDLGCADRWRCDKDLASQSADKQDVCCSTDLCNKDYETATGQTTAITTTPTTTAPTTTSATTTTPNTTPTSTTPTTTASETTSTSSATTAVYVLTTMGQHPTTTDATIASRTKYAKNNTIESTTVQPAMTSQQYSTTTDHASNVSQSTPGELTSIPISASYSSSGPTPNASSSYARIDNVTRIDVSTESGWTKDPLETTPTAASADKTNAYTGSDRISDQTTSPNTGRPSTSFTTREELSAASLSASTPTADSSVPYEWIALLGVGVVGALICGVLTLLAFLGIVCAPKQSQGPNVISKELDKTLL